MALLGEFVSPPFPIPPVSPLLPFKFMTVSGLKVLHLGPPSCCPQGYPVPYQRQDTTCQATEARGPPSPG